ncbi:MAG: carbohydrate kinase family protein, partial [Lachnospiraceae bacterium]
DIKRIAPDLSVYAYGKVGKDGKAEFLLDTLRRNGVNADGIKRAETLGTSFTQVMSIEGGERTFFTYAGASADFGYDDIDFDKITAKIFHLGYFLLLEKVDNGDGVKILRELKKRGIKTSIDLVSSTADAYEKVLPCLPFVDYLIINELEAAALCKSDNTDDLRFLAEKLKAMGVKEGVIIHKEDKACFLGESYAEINSLIVPDELFKGKTGAGDAFCAGVLTEIYENAAPEQVLETGIRAAAASIMQANATDGVKTKSEIYEITRSFKRR